MNISSGAAMRALQEATLQRKRYEDHLLFDRHSQQRLMLQQRLMQAYYEEQGTLTEFNNILGHLGVLTWKER